MSENKSTVLSEKRTELLNRIQALVLELSELLQKDIPSFAMRTARKAFIDDLDFAESRSDEQITGFKQRLHQFTDRLGKNSIAKLNASLDLWTNAEAKAGDAKTLEGNPEVWAILVEISPAIERFMKDEGLPCDVPAYKTPLYFIDGKFAPSIIEKYWAALVSLRALDVEIQEDSHERRRAAQAERWDDL
ncbi:MAG: hypothetical protein WC966_06315 [Bradymonadales bacterium]|jgi:hypothetical protein